MSYVLKCSFVGGIDMYNCVFFLDWSFDYYIVSFLSLVIFFNLRYILSDMRISTPAFFCFPFAWTIFLHHLTFSIYVSLGLNCVSCKQQERYGSCFCIHWASWCLWIGAFNLFAFKVIIDIYVPVVIFLILGFDFVDRFLLMYFLTI